MADSPLLKAFRELRRRKVLRVTAVYAVVAWGIIEVVDVVAPALHLPDWTLTLVVLLAALGLPVAIVLAWAFDVTPDGVRRTVRESDSTGKTTRAGASGAGTSSRFPSLFSGSWWILAIGALGVLALAGGAFFVVGGGTGSGEGLVADRIVVLPLENRTGDPALDPVGRLAADWITQGVARAGIGRVMPLTDLLQTFSPDDDPEGLSVADAAEATGAGVVVVGSYYRVGDELQFQTRMLDARRDALIDATEPVSADVSDPRDGISALRERVTGILATVFDPRHALSGGSTRIEGNPPTLEAYEAYADGIDHFLRRDFEKAAPLLLRAGKLDPGFQQATLRSLEAYLNLQRWEMVDSLLAALEEARSRLTREDRLLLDVIRGHLDHDRELSMDRRARLAEMFPNSYFAYGAAWQGLAYNRPQRALRFLGAMDPSRGPMARWPPYWIVYADAYHLRGEYGSELEVAQRAQREFSRASDLIHLELQPLAALGRFEELREALARAEAISDRTPARLRERAASELRAHGHTDTAAVYLGEALAWYGTGTAEERRRRRGEIARTLYQAGRIDSARVLYEEMLSGMPEPTDGPSRSRVVRLRGRLGTILARQGHVREARQIDGWLASVDWPYMLGAPTVWRSRIAAVLGEDDRAVALLREGLQRANFGIWVHSDPDLVRLREHPGFREILYPGEGN